MPEAESDLLHEWLRLTAALTPGAPAIVEDDRVTSFRELFDKAAQLAVCFVEHGIQKQDRIALVLPKTTDAIISVFASLFAGAIYVPIHPQWPKERIEAVIEDCAARLVIEGDGDLPLVHCRTGESISWQAVPVAQAGALSVSSLDSLPEISALDPAFILFTSGSTGRPKGVVLSHRAVGAFVRWHAQRISDLFP